VAHLEQIAVVVLERHHHLALGAPRPGRAHEPRGVLGAQVGVRKARDEVVVVGPDGDPRPHLGDGVDHRVPDQLSPAEAEDDLLEARHHGSGRPRKDRLQEETRPGFRVARREPRQAVGFPELQERSRARLRRGVPR